MSHTLEVSQNARTIAKALRLNEDLVEAIALGHDLGHTPFGHAGERVLNRLTEGRFKHNEQSVRIVEKLEKDGEGLNLTWEVRDGILNHEMNLTPATLEGRIVRLSDKIAYVNADFDDGIRAQLLREEDIPLELRRELGFDTKSRLDHLIHDIIINSMDKDDIVMSEASWQAFLELRKFMFANLYTNPVAKAEEVKAEAMIERLYFYYMEHEELLPQKLRNFLEDGEDLSRIVCDYISGMTDQYAITKFEEFYIPVAWQVDGY
jgi:dGTPase